MCRTHSCSVPTNSTRRRRRSRTRVRRACTLRCDSRGIGPGSTRCASCTGRRSRDSSRGTRLPRNRDPSNSPFANNRRPRERIPARTFRRSPRRRSTPSDTRGSRSSRATCRSSRRSRDSVADRRHPRCRRGRSIARCSCIESRRRDKPEGHTEARWRAGIPDASPGSACPARCRTRRGPGATRAAVASASRMPMVAWLFSRVKTVVGRLAEAQDFALLLGGSHRHADAASRGKPGLRRLLRA